MYISQEVNESATLQFAQVAAAMKKEGKKIYSLGLGEPDFETPEYIFHATEKAMREGFTRYSASQGLPELRKFIAESLTKDYGIDFDIGNVLVTPGVKQALFIALAAILKPGDEVVYISPYYVSYPAIIKLAEPTVSIRDIPLKRADHALDFDLFQSAVGSKTRAILVNSPHNPTGKVFTSEEMHFLAEMAYKSGAYIVSDEVYDKMTFPGRKHIGFAAFERLKDRLILTNGYSKSYGLTGWRIGYAVAPNAEMKIMNCIQQQINTNTCTFIQKGVCSVYENECVHLESYLAEVQRRVDLFHHFITSCPVMDGVFPGGGFFYFADISKTGMSSNEFCSRLIENTGVAATPGLAFGRDWDDHVRFSLAVDRDVLAGAINAMQDWFSSF